MNNMDLENMFDIVSLTTEESDGSDDFDSNSDGDDDVDVEGDENENDGVEDGWETTSENED